MYKGKQLDFSGHTIHCGLDVHKTNWKVSFGMGNKELGAFSQDPDPEKLKNYFNKRYPGAQVKAVYEAGFCGFGIQRSLTQLGIECIVVNAADVASTDKDRKRKADKRDARKLRRELAGDDLEPIFVPVKELEHDRTLVRERHRLVQDQTRCKARIRHMLMFSGMPLEIQEQRWSLKYVKQLEQMSFETPSLKNALQFAIKEYKAIRQLIKEATLAIRDLSKEPRYADIQRLIQTIPGIGLINGMVIQTEIQEMSRFRNLDSLCGYAGFVPDLHSTNDKNTTTGVSKRCNEFLREAIIESSWMLIRKDPAMLMKYNEYTRRMHSNKAIIRIGKHLLARIRYVWNNRSEYQKGIVG